MDNLRLGLKWTPKSDFIVIMLSEEHSRHFSEKHTYTHTDNLRLHQQNLVCEELLVQKMNLRYKDYSKDAWQFQFQYRSLMVRYYS